MFDDKVNKITQNEKGEWNGEDGTKYQPLNNDEIDAFCSRFQDRNTIELGIIYETRVPKITLDMGEFPLLPKDSTKEFFRDMKDHTK
jgi:hypothetical protein